MRARKALSAPKCRRHGRSLGWRLAIWLGAALVVAAPKPVMGCKCMNIGGVGLDEAQVVFTGDVVLNSWVALGNGDVVRAHLIRVDAAWKRALPGYVVVESDLSSCGVNLQLGMRYWFTFSGNGHVGLDRSPGWKESDPAGWAWQLDMCWEMAEALGQGQSDVLQVETSEVARRAQRDAWTPCDHQAADVKPKAAKWAAEPAEVERIAVLTRNLGQPYRPRHRIKVEDFDTFACAYVKGKTALAWPEDWEYAVAATLQLMQALEVDSAADFWWRATKYINSLDRFYWQESVATVLLATDHAADAVILVHAAALSLPLLDYAARRTFGLAHCKGDPFCRSPGSAWTERVRSARFLLQLPRNWRDAPMGTFEQWDFELYSDCWLGWSPSFACNWVMQLMGRHERALFAMNTAYLRHVLLTAGPPWVAGKPEELPDGERAAP